MISGDLDPSILELKTLPEGKFVRDIKWVKNKKLSIYFKNEANHILNDY
jgi:hypothetical protein